MSRMQRCTVALAALSLGVVFVGSGIAEAGFGASATPTFPTTVTVGDIGVPASVEVQNLNTTPDTNTANTVCNFGDGIPCPPGDPGITLIPSCAQLGAFSACTGADPGVFQVSPTGVGDVGTACAGMPFTITLIDQVFGQLRFTPQPLGTHVVLPNTGSLCRINFTFDVLKSPSLDQNPQLPGSQTVQVVDNTQSGSTTGSGTRNQQWHNRAASDTDNCYDGVGEHPTWWPIVRHDRRLRIGEPAAGGLPQPLTAITSCRPTPATWPPSSLTARAPPTLANTSSTTASSCPV